MARLPNSGYLIQIIGNTVVLFDPESQEEFVKFDATDAKVVAIAQRKIHNLTNLNAEDQAMAHFWSGYFYGSNSGTY